jgi:hypothetical protein
VTVRPGIARIIGSCLSLRLAASAALVLGSQGGCVVRGGIGVTPATLAIGSGEAGEVSPGSRSGAAQGPSSTGNKHHVVASGYGPTTDIEESAMRRGIKAINEELDRQQERCGFATPVELVYDVPMKEWVGAEGWGLYRGCSNKIETGGCIHLASVCNEVVKMLWFDICGSPGEGVRTQYKGWNNKVKKIVCRGEAVPPEASAIDREHSRMKAVLGRDGVVTVTLHPSDANVSYEFAQYLEPRLEAD